MKKYILMSVVYFLFMYQLSAQVEWKSYSSGNAVSSIALYGNDLWVGTYGDGLVRVNTQTGDTKIFQKINSGIVSDIIYKVQVDKNGSVLVLAERAALVSGLDLYRFDGNATWTMLSGGSSINDMEVDASNKIWLACDDGVYRLNGNFAKKMPGLPPEEFNAIAFDDKGFQWFGSEAHLFKYKDSVVVSSYDRNTFPLLSSGIDAITCDNDTVWLGTSSNLIKFDGTNWTNWNVTNSTISSDHIGKIVIDKMHNLWLANYNLISKFDGKQFTNYSDTLKIPLGSWAIDICIDNNGKKWVGTTEEGLFKFDTTFVKQNTSNSPLPTARVVCMTEDKNGVKWFATISEFYGITSYDGSNWKSYTKRNSDFTDNNCIDITSDTSGNIWCITQSKLLKFDGVKWVSYLYVNGINGFTKIRFIKGQLWLAGYETAATFDGSKWTSYDVKGAGTLMGIGFDKKGYLWFSSSNNGLYRFYAGNYTNYNASNSGILSNYCTDLCVDNLNNVWIATNLGVSKFDGSKWTDYTASNFSLPETYVYCISADKDNGIWISNYFTLSKLNGSVWKRYDPNNSPVIRPGRVSFDNSGNRWISLSNGGTLFMKGNEIITNISDMESTHSTVQVYPNPTQEEAIVTFKNLPDMNYQLTLQTIEGKTVNVFENITTGMVKINTENLAKGVYIYQLSTSKNLIDSGRLIIQ